MHQAESHSCNLAPACGSVPALPDIPQVAVDAVATALTDAHHFSEPYAADLARTCLEAAEQAWPHDPPGRDAASTISATTGYGLQRTVPPRGRFGFGPAEVRA